jgi:hypothetical protein
VTSRRLRTELGAQPTALLDRLLDLAARGLPQMYLDGTDEFAFTRAPGADGVLELRGTSTRYAAIVALGAHWLPEPRQREVFHGRTAAEYVTLLVRRLPQTTNLGDVALVCWAAAQADHPMLPEALSRLAQLDDDRPQYVVEASWVLAALVAARRLADTESALARARARLLSARLPASPLFPHATADGLLPWYRSHVACYADQVYPIQALAMLHASADDPRALAAANNCAARICELQGDGGQWWWHYDARTGGLVEGYPVYTVHQHAMGPMALLDLADAGGADHRDAIELGLGWMTQPAELGPGGEPMVRDDDGVTWRKVYRGDPAKVVRAVQGVTTRAVPGMRVPGIGRIYRPAAIDRECRPYEFGWLLYAWLKPPGGAAGSTALRPSSAVQTSGEAVSRP